MESDPRATLSECANISSWSRCKKYDGLAHGWSGGAWVWFQLTNAGLIKDSDRVREAIFRRLQKAVMVTPSHSAKQHISHLIGTGAIPVIAAIGCSQDDRFRQILPQTLHWWAASCQASKFDDLMWGAAGALMASAEIESYVPGSVPRSLVKMLHRRCKSTLEKEIERSRSRPVYLGLSHGLAGYLLAMESAKATFHLPFEDSLRSQGFDRIMDERFEAPGKAALWPAHSGASFANLRFCSWCHGNPGMSLAFMICHKLTGKNKYASAAKMGLAGSLLKPQKFASFCCGATGVAQIFLEAYRLYRDARWLKKAKTVAQQAFAMKLEQRHNGFYKGILGMRYLSWRLAYPEKLPLLGLGAFSRQ